MSLMAKADVAAVYLMLVRASEGQPVAEPHKSHLTLLIADLDLVVKRHSAVRNLGSKSPSSDVALLAFDEFARAVEPSFTPEATQKLLERLVKFNLWSRGGMNLDRKWAREMAVELGKLFSLVTLFHEFHNGSADDRRRIQKLREACAE